MSAGEIVLDKPRYADFPEYTPDLSPGRMLAARVFDLGYFHGWGDDQIEGIDPAILASGPNREKPNPKGNAFSVHSGLPIEEWRRRGWIREDLDPVGWFQWFCRFHSGRRTDDDVRQIGRWQDFANRWQPKSVEALERMKPGAKTRQALLHWGQDPYGPERKLGIEIDEKGGKR